MGRLHSCLLLVALCAGVVVVSGDDDPWFPDPWKTSSPPPVGGNPTPLYPSPDTPSPYYDAPPYMSGEPPVPNDGSPTGGSPPPDGPEPSPWFPCGLWAKKTEAWPSPYTPDTSIGDTFGSDAVKVYGQVSMLDGILSKGDDGYSDLLKEGITALLNAIDAHFKYTEDEIKKCFTFKTALSSEDAASKQANLFRIANEGYSP